MLVSSSQLASARTPGSLVLRHGRQQTRDFRFGRLWATYWADGGSHRDDIYRRPRCFRYNYTESLDSTIEAGKGSPSGTRRSLAGHHLHSYWGIHCRGPHANIESKGLASQLPDNPEGIRPGRNIEDVERQPLEDLLFGSERKIDTWQSHYTKIRNQRWSKAKRAHAKTAEIEPQHTIDPITNRKVLKAESDSSYATPEGGLDMSSNTFSKYKPQFSSLGVPTEDPGHVTGFSKGSAVTGTYGGRPKLASQQPGSSIFDTASLPRQPILESEKYVAEVNDTPVPDLLRTLKAHHNEVSWHRGDGIVPPVPPLEPVWMNDTAFSYSDLDKYRPVEDPEPPFAVAESAEQQYEDLKDYDAVRYREPDGKIEGAEAVPQYEDLDKYGAFRAHEPNGKYKQSVLSSVDPQELEKYQPYRSHEPDGKYAAAYSEPEIEASELEQYSKPYLSHEPDGKYAQSQEVEAGDSELHQYQAFRCHEPDGKYAHDTSTPVRGANEVKSYTAVRSHEPDGKYAEQATPELTPNDLGSYTAFRSHEPDGNYAAEAEASNESPDSGNHEAFGYDESETSKARQIPANESLYDASELGKYDAVRHNEPDGKTDADAGLEVYDDAELGKYRTVPLDDLSGQDATPEKSHYRQMLEKCMSEAAVESDTVDADTKASLRKSKTAGLTGNYVRDFPEEFTRSWSTENSDSKSSLAPSDMSRFETEEQQLQPVAVPAEALQPALERQLTSEQVSESPGVNTANPVVYKVLVYDPVMQCIDTAETTSIVPDSATPLTPAEVLLRISNPAKFLPHFGPLQAQGFEIVSGAGDVLVFRKVRDAIPDATPQPAATEIKTESVISSRPAVNPIDMTGEPRDYTIAAERFASPTGFVNYDLPTPRFDSKVDVRQEKPVFSRSKKHKKWAPKDEPKDEPKIANVAKRIAIGALWAGGLTYSAGLLIDRYWTGGQDGKGPKRL